MTAQGERSGPLGAGPLQILSPFRGGAVAIKLVLSPDITSPCSQRPGRWKAYTLSSLEATQTIPFATAGEDSRTSPVA